MGPFTRRRLLILAGTVAAGVVGARLALPGWLRRPPPRVLEGEVRDFVDRLLEGIDRRRMWDVHAHVFGLGDGDTGCEVSYRSLSWLHPVENARFETFLAASGVDLAGDRRDQQYVERLLALHRLGNPEGRLVLLAFDRVVDEQGREDALASAYYTPNEYVLQLAERHPDVEAAVSIHPYRSDAVERLEAAAARGARQVKWLPAAMGIDPASELCDPFYEALARLRIPLLTHAGAEAAVANQDDAFGNPLRLRRPLEHGVRVVVAHCAGTGSYPDLDEPERARPTLPASDLFFRLMDESRYEQNLFGGLSAITQVNRAGSPLRRVLRARHLQHRMVNGSDYPLPAIDPLISTWQLERLGLLEPRERRLCNAVFEANPLLFDVVVKRCLALREDGRELRLSPTVFETDWLYT